MHDGTPVFKIRQQTGEACVNPDGSSAPLKTDESFVERLKRCHEAADAADAVKVLAEISEADLAPTASTFLRVIETCTSSLDLDLAEEVLHSCRPYHGPYEKPAVVQASAKALIAKTYLASARPRDALHVLGWFDHASERNLSGCLDGLKLGSDDLAWGCLIRALTGANLPIQAVAVGREAMQRGVVMSDSLIFFLLEALRAMGAWQEADAFFRSAVDAGTLPHERTVGSLLRTLTAPGTRRFVDRSRVIELVRLPKEPSVRFRVVSLIALASIGEVTEAKSVFGLLEKESDGGQADERAFSILIGSYASFLERGVPDNSTDKDIRGWYAEFIGGLDDAWARYMAAYGGVPPSRQAKDARSRAFQRFLWAKSRALRPADAVDALEKAVDDKASRKWLNIGQAHFVAVLSGVEATCDTGVMERVLELMAREGVPHDHRSLAFCVSALLGQGDTDAAVRLVQTHLPSLTTPHALEHQRAYRVRLLVRRLQMLVESARDAGRHARAVGELSSVCRRLEERLKRASGASGGSWR